MTLTGCFGKPNPIRIMFSRINTFQITDTVRSVENTPIHRL